MIRGSLEHVHPFSKILFTMMVLLVSMFVFVFLALITAVPLFGFDFSSILALQESTPVLEHAGLLKYLQSVQSTGIFIVTPVIAALFFSRNIFSYFNFNKPQVIQLILGITIIIAALPLINYLVSMNLRVDFPNEAFKKWAKEQEELAAQITNAFLHVNSFNGYLINLLVIAVIPALGEELFFRGLIQRLLSELMRSSNAGILFAAFFFALFHFQFYGIIPRFFLGVLLGYLFYWSGSIWLPILIHFVNNALAVSVAYFLRHNSAAENYFETIGAMPDTFYISIISTVLVLLLSYWFYRISAETNRGKLL